VAVVLTGPGVGEMKALAVKLREADPRLRRALLARFRQAGAPIVRDVQVSILDMPAEHYPQAGLRAEVARTVFASAGVTRSGVRLDIVSAGRRMPAGKQNLPNLLNQPGGFYHPVFARGARFTMGRSRAKRYARKPVFLRPMVKRGAWEWTHQQGKPHWFEEPVARSANDVRVACEAALEEVKRSLEV